MPRSDKFFFTTGSCKARLIALLTLSTASLDKLAGAIMPYQESVSNFGNPCSAIVGISGANGARVKYVVPIAFNFQDLIWGKKSGRLPNIMSILPANKSVNAGPWPRYGI